MLSSQYNGHPVHLIESLDEFDFIKSLLNPSVNIGLDTETSGLDFYEHSVVGVCISVGKSYSPQDYHGFYLPVRHTSYSKNLPIPEVISFVQCLVDNFKSVWWNRNFDFTMLEKEGLVCPFVGKTHDAQCMAHLVVGESFPALKEYAATYLKYEVIEFSQNNAKDHNFGTTDPTITYVYAAQDPIVTALLARKLWAEYPYIRKIYPVDNKVAEALRKFTYTTDLYLDKEFLQKELDKNLSELESIKRQIFALTGYSFKLNSTRDKADALSRFVTLTQKTAKGAFAVNEEALSKIDHPLAKLLMKYAELEKFRGTYLAKMLEFPNPFHVNYQHCNVSTGRLSSGGSKGNSFFANFNIQNVPKVEVMRYVHRDPELGYICNDIKEGAIGKVKTKAGMRDAFICPEGYVWLSADYSSEEMILMANFSGEMNLIEPLLSGEDIHKYVATKMFGHYDPTHRTIAKVINFASNYGASGYTIGQKLGVSEEEGTRLLNRYNESLPQLTRWKEHMIKEARRKGMVFTYFGRPRSLYQYYQMSDRSKHAFADRTAVNSPVQGTGGDLIRLDLIKLWQKFISDPEFAANCKFANTVHDEINLFVKPSYLKKAYDVLLEIMTFHPSNFKVPITAAPSVGHSWGTQIECEGISEDNKIILDESSLYPLD